MKKANLLILSLLTPLITLCSFRNEHRYENHKGAQDFNQERFEDQFTQAKNVNKAGYKKQKETTPVKVIPGSAAYAALKNYRG